MAYSYPSPETFDTLPKMLRMRAKSTPKGVALRKKDFGIWEPTTWMEYHTQVAYLALFLSSRGFGKGDVFAMIGENNPWWVSSELAAQSVGCMTLGFYRDGLDKEVGYLLGYSGAKGVFAEDQEQVDKLLNVAEQINKLELIIYEDPRGLRNYDDPRLVSLEDALAEGKVLYAKDEGRYDQLVDAVDGSEVAILSPTSGTTSNPKLAMLPAKGFIRHLMAYLEVEPKDAKDEYVSILPLAWIMGQVYDVGFNLVSGMKVNFPESPATVMQDLCEIGPTFMLGSPRLLEEMVANMRARIMDASRLNQWVFNTFVKRGMKKVALSKRDKLADVCLFSALRDRYGLSRVRSMATGGAAMGPDTFKLFLAMGLPLRQLYGQTELMGGYTSQVGDREELDFVSVGPPFRGVEVRVDDPDSNGVGEIVSKHQNMFVGYYKNEAAYKADVRDGWMYTGDVGYFDDKKRLVVLDRLQDMVTMEDGSRFSPQYIENRLKFSPHVGEAVVFGEKESYLSALVCIRFSVVAKWAEKNQIPFTSYTGLAASEKVGQLLEKEVEKVNAYLPTAHRIAKFILLFKELDVDDGEITHTRKIRRAVVNERYKEIIRTLYSDDSVAKIDTEVTYEDGRKGRIQADLKVRFLEGVRTESGKKLSKAS